MEKKFTGIVISVKDYRENDKIITLLTAEEGLVNIAVQNPKDKTDIFVFARELFTFGYFKVNNFGGIYYDLIKCEIIDTFENIKTNQQKLIEATNLILIVKEFAQFGTSAPNILQELLSALKCLCYEKTYSQNFVLTKFFVILLNIICDFRNNKFCKVCGEELKSSVLFFDLQKNAFVCINCQSKNTIVFNKKDVEILDFMQTCSYNQESDFSNKNLLLFLEKILKIFRYSVSERFKFYRG